MGGRTTQEGNKTTKQRKRGTNTIHINSTQKQKDHHKQRTQHVTHVVTNTQTEEKEEMFTQRPLKKKKGILAYRRRIQEQTQS